MSQVVDITPFLHNAPFDEKHLGEVACDVRQFLRSVWLGEDTHVDEESLEDARQLIEDFALHAAALRDNQEGARYGQDLTLAQVASVLRYMSMIEVREGSECYGHSGEATTCGKNLVLDWLERNVSRYADKLGELAADDDGDAA